MSTRPEWMDDPNETAEPAVDGRCPFHAVRLEHTWSTDLRHCPECHRVWRHGERVAKCWWNGP